MSRILVVDDEPSLQKTVRRILEDAGHAVRQASDAEEGLAELRRETPDLLLLDVRLPGKDGFDLCKQLRNTPEWKDLAVIFLTSRDEEAHRVLGLELGGDDYMAKPFSAPELLARVKAVMRRRKPPAVAEENESISDGGLSVDVAGHRVEADGKAIKLPAKEFQLLCLLARKKGRVLSRSFLMESVWNREHLDTSRTVDTHVYRLRKRLGPLGSRIVSVGTVGYKWE
jgi:DNA-binding response OmpR family regulator